MRSPSPSAPRSKATTPSPSPSPTPHWRSLEAVLAAQRCPTGWRPGCSGCCSKPRSCCIIYQWKITAPRLTPPPPPHTHTACHCEHCDPNLGRAHMEGPPAGPTVCWAVFGCTKAGAGLCPPPTYTCPHHLSAPGAAEHLGSACGVPAAWEPGGGGGEGRCCGHRAAPGAGRVCLAPDKEATAGTWQVPRGGGAERRPPPASAPRPQR